MAEYRLSVIAPCRNEEKYIVAFIKNMLSQDFPKKEMELLIIDGKSNDNTQYIVSKYCVEYPFIRLIVNEMQTVPHALNLGVKQAKGSYIIRVDCHAIYPVNYFTCLIKNLDALKADNVGGAWETVPAKDTSLCRAIAIVTSNKFGVGDSYHKIGATEITKVDTVPFGCFHRELFDRIGYFDEDLIRNQDDEFNGRIIKNGGNIYLLPQLVIKYFARETAGKMAKMFYQYGLFKPLVNKKLGSPTSLRQFVPLCFLLGLITSATLSIFSKIMLDISLSIIVLYVILSIFFTRKQLKKEPLQIFFLPWLFFMIHLSYGWGYLMGIFRFLIFNKKTATITINR